MEGGFLQVERIIFVDELLYFVIDPENPGSKDNRLLHPQDLAFLPLLALFPLLDDNASEPANIPDFRIGPLPIDSPNPPHRLCFLALLAVPGLSIFLPESFGQLGIDQAVGLDILVAHVDHIAAGYCGWRGQVQVGSLHQDL